MGSQDSLSSVRYISIITFFYIFELYFNGVLEELDLVKGLLYNSLVTENKLKALLSVNLHVFGTEVHLLCAFKILCIIMCQTDK